MERFPEQELMEDWEQAIAYAQADFDAPHSAFIQHLTQTFPTLSATGYALDLGCGPGDITIRFARAFPQWQIDGVDGSPSMLKLGSHAIQSQQLDAQIAFHSIYLPQGTLPRTAYDFIFSNSLLHHLADPLDLWRSLSALSHPDTPVFIMDLMRPASREMAESMRDQYAAGEPPVLREDFFNSLLAAYRLDEIRQQLAETQLAHLTVEAVSDRHWIAWGYPQASSK